LRELAVQLELEEIRLSPGQEWVTQPGQWRFVLLRSGTAYWLDAVRPRELAEGELLVVPTPSSGMIRSSQLGEAVVQWFGFEPSSLLGFWSLVEREWIEQYAVSPIEPVSSLPSRHPLALEMAQLRACADQDWQVVERAKALLLALRVLAECIPPPRATLKYGGASRERFEQIICRMPDAELVQRNSVELARLCGCTPRHFNRLFRKHFGAPTRVRQTELRLLKARRLLEESTQTVGQIATDCGYQSLRLFNSLFKRRFGKSPSEWKRERS